MIPFRLERNDAAGVSNAPFGGADPDALSPVRRGPILWLILCGVCLISAIGIGTAMIAQNFRERALRSSERELENAALLLERHFDKQFRDMDAAQKDIIAEARQRASTSPDDFRRIMAGLDVHEMLRHKLSGQQSAAGINVFDADGMMINSSSAWPPLPISIADRDYFLTHKRGGTAQPLVIRAVRGRISGEWMLSFSRGIAAADGTFLGLVNRAIPVAEIAKFFESVSLGENSAIGIYHADGTLTVRHPHVDGMIGRNFAASPLHNVLARSDVVTSRKVGLVDSRELIVHLRRFAHFPLTLSASITVASALADWRDQIRFLVIVAALAASVIALILFLIVRQLVRQHRAANARLALEKHRFETAVNNMPQGLALFDASARLVMCNPRLLDLHGMSPDVVKPGCEFRDIIKHRVDIGTFSGDVESYCDRVIGSKGRSHTFVQEIGNDRVIQMVHEPTADGGWVTTHEDITERRRAEERIAYLAHYDALTDLPNRVLFREQIERELTSLAPGDKFAVLYIDIDEFKTINDSLGHPVGDEMLKSVAMRLKACVAPTDFVARLGGDEFAVVQTAMREDADITALVERVHRAIREPYHCLGHQLATDASIGIAVAPNHGADLDQLIKNADLAMYAAKADGRHTHRFFEAGMDAAANARRVLEVELRGAVAEDALDIHYQPIVSLQDGTVAGCEALLRWRHPQRGMISPAEFIPVAEDTGLINQIGAWVLEAACAEAATWPAHVTLAVNVSPVQFKCQTLALRVATALASSGLAPSRLELEITETVLIRDDEAALATLHQLRALGVRIALDDFGTGFSSLSYLRRFPFDRIKIDRSFIKDVTENGGATSIVRAVVGIAAACDMTTTAEGVETAEQRQILKTLGCTQMQGFLFSPPRPADEIRSLLAPHHVAADDAA